MADPALERIDRSLEKMDAHMARGNDLMDSVREEVRLTREEVRLSREERADTRQFMRELLRRYEKTTDGQVAALDKVGASVARLSTNVDDLRADSMVQRAALFALIDRLGPAGGAAAGA
jgi:uncharacterized protein YpuA (DUF1002 family)